MKFIINTKPLSDSLDLGVINANVSKLYQKSTLAQITATRDSLIINLAASQITTEIRLAGKGDEDGPVKIFVNCMLFKQLVHSFDSSTIEMEFVDGGLILHSGKSKFTLAQIGDSDNSALDVPSSLAGVSYEQLKLDTAGWKFVKDRQMFALSMSFMYPVYTMAWVGENGNLLVSDYMNELFTLSSKGSIHDTCLLTDTIINLFTSYPEGTVFLKLPESYMLQCKKDSFEICSEFKPRYESDEGMGDYRSDMIIDMINRNQDEAIQVNTKTLNKFLSQVDLLSISSDDCIKVSISDGKFSLSDSRSHFDTDIQGRLSKPFVLSFKTNMFKSVCGDFSDEIISISPCYQNDDPSGIIISNDELSIMLAGVEESVE